MFCKSGIFIFAENNYLVRQYICPHHVLIKHLCSIRALVPMSFFLSLPPFRLIPWSAEAEFTFLPRLLKPSGEGALRLHPIERAPEALVNRASPMQGLYWLSA